MSYTKQTWAKGDTITAEKLNHMETGIEDAGSSGGGGTLLKLNLVGDSSPHHLDKTYAEIETALLAGSCICWLYNGTYYMLTTLTAYDDLEYPDYHIYFDGQPFNFVHGTSANDYPEEDMD